MRHAAFPEWTRQDLLGIALAVALVVFVTVTVASTLYQWDRQWRAQKEKPNPVSVTPTNHATPTRKGRK
jgi:hypothetical protein